MKIKTVKFKELPDAKKIKKWLEEDDSGREWRQGDNPNCFHSNRLEAIYVYKGFIKYWDDIRVNTYYLNKPTPSNKEELFDLFNPKRTKMDIKVV